jgi:8-oxo-dGTP pyrophosphatase MutT (NUDIX family)
MNPESVSSVLDEYDEAYPGTEDLTNGLRRLLREHGPDAVRRTTWDGHITAGAVLYRTNGDVLLIHHRALDRWLLPGGHIEPEDATLTDAARRELAEETGLDLEGLELLATYPLEINRHTIPANPRKGEPEHEHWDFRFAFTGDLSDVTLQEEEVTAWEWGDLSRVSPLLTTRLHALIAPRY